MTAEKRAIYKEIEQDISKSQSILITCHVDPDGDSIGSELALLRYIDSFKKEVTIVNHDAAPSRYGFLPFSDRIRSIKEYRGTDRFDLAIILECPSLKRAGEAAGLISPETKVINIDHHRDNSGYGDVVLIDAEASAVAEMLVEFFLGRGFEIDGDMATLLYAGILTDTGRFRFSSTTQRTMEIAGMLIEYGANPREICDRIYYCLSEPMLKLTGRVFSQSKLFNSGRICLIFLDRETLKTSNLELPDAEGLAEYTLYGKDVVVGGLLREIDDVVTRVSLRSRNSINVCSLAQKYGGGGHFNASGFTINLPIKVAGERLLEDLRELVNDSV